MGWSLSAVFGFQGNNVVPMYVSTRLGPILNWKLYAKCSSREHTIVPRRPIRGVKNLEIGFIVPVVGVTSQMCQVALPFMR